MSTADLVILVVIFLSVALGLWRGLVKEVLSLVAWLLAFWLALSHWDLVAGFLTRAIGSPAVRGALAFSLLFVGVLVLGAIATRLVGKALDGAGLSTLDRLLGGLFGLVRGVALIVVALTVLSFFGMERAAWYRGSSIAPQLAPYVAWVRSHLSEAPRT